MLLASLAFMGVCLLLATSVADNEGNGVHAIAEKATAVSSKTELQTAKIDLARAAEHSKKQAEAEKDLANLKKELAGHAAEMAKVDEGVADATANAKAASLPDISSAMEALRKDEGEKIRPQGDSNTQDGTIISTESGEKPLEASSSAQQQGSKEEQREFERLALKKMLADAGDIEPAQRGKVISMARVIIHRMARKREAMLLRQNAQQDAGQPTAAESRLPLPPAAPAAAPVVQGNLQAEIAREVHAEVQKEVSLSVRAELKPLMAVLEQLVAKHADTSSLPGKDPEPTAQVPPPKLDEEADLDGREQATISDVDSMIADVDEEIRKAKIQGEEPMR